LKETCYKAGLPGEAWKDPETRIYGFTCEILSMEERGKAK
jgi:AMMECR1 domain-containing protein